MSTPTHHHVAVVKRGGQRPTELFDHQKLHDSVYAACLSVRSLEGHAIDTAQAVCKVVVEWLTGKAEVTSADLRTQASAALTMYHPEAAYLYQHHRLIM